MENILEQIEKEASVISNLRESLPVIELSPLHSNRNNFIDPTAFGIYKSTGGHCLGVCKNSYKPVDLRLFLDTIVNSCIESKLDINLNKIQYTEFNGGKKVSFKIPLKDFEIKSPMKGDILKTSLLFSTGFDATTKTKISYSTYRLWCKNGAARWENAQQLSFKNTKNNGDKFLLFTEEIIKTADNIEEHVKHLGELTKRPVTKEQIDEFYLRITGIDKSTYDEAHGKTKKHFDALNEAVAIETENTGMNLFSLDQAITRYATHQLSDNTTDLYFGNANSYIERAESILYSLN